MKISFLFLITGIFAAGLFSCQSTSKTISTADKFTGSDTLWRPRQSMVFFLDNDKGGEFGINFSIRDMNIYQEGERPAYIFVIGPKGKVLADKLIPDDGIVKGKPEYKDGYADIGMDVRYREYHRVNSPNKTPPGKKRSPFLITPEQITPRVFKLDVPNAGEGIYRVYVGSCWDHWISITPSRPMNCGVYPGLGSMYVPDSRFQKAYMYVPENTKDISFAISEEIQPYNWKLKVSDESGIIIAKTTPGTFLNYAVAKKVKGSSVLELNIEGNTSGACLHIKGAPPVICANPETANKIAKAFGKYSDPDQATVMQWAKCLDTKNLKTDLVRQKWQTCATEKINKFDYAITFSASDHPQNINVRNAFQLLRSSWWPLKDAAFIKDLVSTKKLSKQYIPPKVIIAMNNLFRKWALARMLMEQGVCSNQWTYDLKDMAEIVKFTNCPKIKAVLDFNVKRFCSPNSLGRVNPDPTPFSDKSKVRYSYSSDTGRIGGGVPAECLGHDSEYGLESTMNMSKVWEKYKYSEIIEWLDNYYVTKTYLTLPKTANIPKKPFSETCSPTDINTRTRYYTHKSPIGKIHDIIAYGPIWQGKKGKKNWPCLESKSFFKNIDNRWFFVKTPSYYAVIFGGAGEPPTLTWNQSELKNNSAELVGPGGMGYGGYQRAKKAGGFSAIWLNNSGVVSVGSNHNVMYSNTIWGRVNKSLYKKWGTNVDPRMIAECFSSPVVDYSKDGRRYIKSGVIPNTPLKYEREIVLNDDSIDVTIKLTAQKTIYLKNLYEAIPLCLDKRKLQYQDKGKFTSFKLPESLTTPSHKSLSGNYTGINPTVKTFTTNEVKLTSVNGSGILILLDKKYNIMLSQPLKYRKTASVMSGLNIALPLVWEKGQSKIIKYTIRML